jgi:hypothetical protein
VQRAWSEIMNVLGNLKGSVGRWNLDFWRLEQFYTIFLDLSKTNKGTTVKEQKWWREKFMYVLKFGSFI